jgi:aspartyl-tRNA(Asn)/glutamyl-tRNA(Gln) amidotransferase subunit C
MKIDRDLVAKVARLSALRLSNAEEAELAAQLTRIVEHFETIRQVPEALLAGGADASPTPLRTDAACDGSPGPLLAANAPEMAHGHFVVPRVVSRD